MRKKSVAPIPVPRSDEQKNNISHIYKKTDVENADKAPLFLGLRNLVKKILEELLAGSDRSIPESKALQYDTEKELSDVDWSVKDVLVGSLGSEKQFKDNITRKYYYLPEKSVDFVPLSVRYVALYRSGIRYYGEVEYAKRLRRREIDFPMRRNNGSEWYYAFRIKGWQTLANAISFKDECVYDKPRFTNLFLLKNCTLSYELFTIQSGDQFRLMCEIKRMLNSNLAEYEKRIEPFGYLSARIAIYKHDGFFDVLKENGQPLFYPSIKISEYLKHPEKYYKYIVDKLNQQNVQAESNYL